MVDYWFWSKVATVIGIILFFPALAILFLVLIMFMAGGK